MEDFDFIEIIESKGIGEIRLGGNKIKGLTDYELKRGTDIAELKVNISVPIEYLKTNLIP